MARCSICGKDIGILDSTTSYYDSTGVRVEVHTACKARMEAERQAQSYSEAFQSAGPQLYTPVTEDEAAGVYGSPTAAPQDQAVGPLGINKTTWYVAGGVAAGVVLLGVLVGAVKG